MYELGRVKMYSIKSNKLFSINIRRASIQVSRYFVYRILNPKNINASTSCGAGGIRLIRLVPLNP
jgi:hypothetical protein